MEEPHSPRSEASQSPNLICSEDTTNDLRSVLARSSIAEVSSPPVYLREEDTLSSEAMSPTSGPRHPQQRLSHEENFEIPAFNAKHGKASEGQHDQQSPRQPSHSGHAQPFLGNLPADKPLTNVQVTKVPVEHEELLRRYSKFFPKSATGGANEKHSRRTAGGAGMERKGVHQASKQSSPVHRARQSMVGVGSDGRAYMLDETPVEPPTIRALPFVRRRVPQTLPVKRMITVQKALKPKTMSLRYSNVLLESRRKALGKLKSVVHLLAKMNSTGMLARSQTNLEDDEETAVSKLLDCIPRMMEEQQLLSAWSSPTPTQQSQSRSHSTKWEVDDTERDSTPIWQQGNKRFYTRKALEKRQKLKTNNLVKSEIDKWWFVATNRRKKATVSKRTYFKINHKIYLSLVGDGTMEDIEESAAEDWEEDSKGHKSLSYDLFYNSIFQLVDHWTETMKAENMFLRPSNVLVRSYAAFAALLFSDISDGKRWKKDSDIEGIVHGDKEDGGDWLGRKLDSREAPVNKRRNGKSKAKGRWVKGGGGVRTQLTTEDNPPELPTPASRGRKGIKGRKKGKAKKKGKKIVSKPEGDQHEGAQTATVDEIRQGSEVEQSDASDDSENEVHPVEVDKGESDITAYSAHPDGFMAGWTNAGAVRAFLEGTDKSTDLRKCSNCYRQYREWEARRTRCIFHTGRLITDTEFSEAAEMERNRSARREVVLDATMSYPCRSPTGGFPSRGVSDLEVYSHYRHDGDIGIFPIVPDAERWSCCGKAPDSEGCTTGAKHVPLTHEDNMIYGYWPPKDWQLQKAKRHVESRVSTVLLPSGKPPDTTLSQFRRPRKPVNDPKPKKDNPVDLEQVMLDRILANIKFSDWRGMTPVEVEKYCLSDFVAAGKITEEEIRVRMEELRRVHKDQVHSTIRNLRSLRLPETVIGLSGHEQIEGSIPDSVKSSFQVTQRYRAHKEYRKEKLRERRAMRSVRSHLESRMSSVTHVSGQPNESSSDSETISFNGSTDGGDIGPTPDVQGPREVVGVYDRPVTSSSARSSGAEEVREVEEEIKQREQGQEQSRRGPKSKSSQKRLSLPKFDDNNLNAPGIHACHVVGCGSHSARAPRDPKHHLEGGSQTERRNRPGDELEDDLYLQDLPGEVVESIAREYNLIEEKSRPVKDRPQSGNLLVEGSPYKTMLNLLNYRPDHSLAPFASSEYSRMHEPQQAKYTIPQLKAASRAKLHSEERKVTVISFPSQNRRPKTNCRSRQFHTPADQLDPKRPLSRPQEEYLRTVVGANPANFIQV